MIWFTENPWPLVWIGTLVLLVLVGVWRTTRHKAVFWVMGGVAAAVTAAVIVEWYVVTEYEEIEQALHDAADAIEAGDLDAVLAFLAAPPEAEELRSIIRRYLPDYPVREFTFDDPQVKFIEGDGRRYAEIKVWFKVYLEDPKLAEGRDPIPVVLTLKARKTDDRWLLIDYRHEFPGVRL